MKKRLFATFLSLCIVISLLPVTALADGDGDAADTTLPTAVDGVIKLTSDVTLTSAYTVSEGTTVTIDLAGHKLTNAANQHTITNNGNLTITDSVGGGVVDNVSHARAAVMNNNGAICTILAGQFTRSQENGQSSTNNGGNSYYTINNYGTMTFGTEDGANNITVTANGNYSSLVHNGWQNSSAVQNKTATMTIYGGTFTGGINTIKNDEGGTLTINGGTFNNVTQYAVQNWNKATINGGTFVSSTYPAVFNGAETQGTSDGQLTINDGEFTAPSNRYVISSNNADGADVDIKGGTYKGGALTNATSPYEEGKGSVIQADGSFKVDSTANRPTDSKGNVYADETAAAANNEAKIGDTYYATLQAAISAAEEKAEIILLKDITLDNKDISDVNTGVINISKNITLNGYNHTISASDSWKATSEGKVNNHIINITGSAQVEIKNLTIDGNKQKTKHGINVYAAEGAEAAPKVTLTKVTIQDCGTAAIVVNHSEVTATNLQTSGNAWGAVNVDKKGTFTLVSGNLSEDAQIWSEDAAAEEDGSKISVPVVGWSKVTVNNAGKTTDDVKTHYTTDITKLGEAYNVTTNTVYDTVERALKAAEDNQTISVIKDATISEDTTIPANVTLNIWTGVTLTIPEANTLTNNGTVNNYGTISGTITNGNSGTLKQAYKLSFNANGGTCTNSEATPVEGTVITLPSASRTGYRFLGWLYNGKVYQAGKSFTMPNADVTLVAQWSKNASPAPSYSVSTPTSANGTVTVSPSSAQKNAMVTITVKPDTGYQLATLTVTDANGNQLTLTKKSDTQYTFTMPASKVTVQATFEEIPQIHVCPAEKFTDVDTTQWYHEAIDYVIEAGMMNGVAADKFAPNSTTTRGMIVTILYRLEGEPAVAGASAFTDVESGAWYADPIAWAAAKGVVNGTSATTFDPNDPITREQMAAILYRYASYKGYDVTEKADLSSYTDAGQISAYATDAMAWANAEGLITGVTKTTLEPQGNATRAQVATILMRFCENVVK